MKVILGLGNPGREYERTRHNVGWWVLDHLAESWGVTAWRRDGQALSATARVGPRHVRLLKPLTFMNLSGAAITPFRRRAFWSLQSDLLVIVDDVALPVGTFRLRARGSAGGHNGLKSIEQAAGSRDYARLRVGVESAEPELRIGDLADFVLAPFASGEREMVRQLFPRMTSAIELWLSEGIERAMNEFNRERSA